jgi:hypothetical protein
MNQISEYKVVTGINKIELEKEVNFMITEGWVPTGGVIIIPSPNSKEIGGDLIAYSINCFQAMVKLKNTNYSTNSL